MNQELLKGYRLSPQQKRIALAARNGAACRVQCALLLKGSLDRELLLTALSRLVARHEILRTTFTRLPGVKVPVQVIRDECDFGWREISLDSGHGEGSMESATWPAVEQFVEREFEAEKRLALEIEDAPPVRFSLLRLAADQHALLCTLSALCADGVTVENLMRELGRTYRLLSEPGDSSDEPVQYVQFSEWQNELLKTGEDDPGLQFWQERNPSALLPPLLLPLEKQASPLADDESHAANAGQHVASQSTESQGFAPQVYTFILDAETTTSIEHEARRHATTPAVLLFSCWKVLLWRLTNQAELAVNFLCEGRVYEEMQEAFGLYERWPFVLSHLDERSRFADVLHETDKRIAEVKEWQEYFSWEQQSEGESETGNKSFHAVGFASRSWPEDEHSASSLRVSLLKQYCCTDFFKLQLTCVRRDDFLQLELHYAPAFYEAETIRLYARRYATLLRDALQNPSAEIAELDILDAEEKHRVLYEWNETQAERARDEVFSRLFEKQAERTPDAVAVVYEAETLSYGELNRRANHLARYLRRRGCGVESRVVLFAARSIETMIGLLGIWKAGSVYVPLDPTQPRARLSLMLEDVGASVVLTQERLKNYLPENCAGAVVCLDSEMDEIMRGEGSNLEVEVSPANLAYIIYTSGSTGIPKGVMVQHASLLNLAQALDQFVYREARPRALRVSLNAPLSFDSSVKQLLQLLRGHALHIVPEEVRRDGAELLSYIERHELDVLDCTPSQLRILLDAGLDRKPELLLVGGEALDDSLWQTLAEDRAHTFYNVYGPTECTVDATAHRIDAATRRPTIGRPLENTQVYIMDKLLRLVAVGVAGELLIGGCGLARGYLNRPDATAGKFVPHPFAAHPGARLYRTGDLARYLADGNIEFLGRVDFQVKIRGSRIELGEIESALEQHPSVRRSVVVVREDIPGDQRLIAYVVSRPGATPSGNDLRRFLQERLPDYMIPSAFAALDTLPLTSNGKVDRVALPDPDQTRHEIERVYVAPRTPVEEMLTTIWGQLLKVERVSINDNFFDLGGHSLLATQVISQARKTFRVEMPLRALFEEPVVADFARRVEMMMREQQFVPTPLIEPVLRPAKLPLSFAQQRLWFLYQMNPGSPFYNIPAPVRLSGALDADVLARSLGEVIRRHESLRTTFPIVNRVPVQHVADAPRDFSLPLKDISSLSPDEREQLARRLAAEDARQPFDLSTGPLVRALLLRLDDDHHLLLLCLHHIISDGWSTSILVRELATLYEAYTVDRPSPLPALPVQYADYTLWQHRHLTGDALAEQLGYWREQLAGAPAVLELPTDRVRPAVQSYRGATVSFAVERALSERLEELSRQEGVTLFMTLLAAFNVLLHRYSHQEDIVVGTPIAGRNRSEIEPLIGFFVNTLALRTQMSGNPKFVELLAQVKEATLGAYAHQEMPFEKLVEELRPAREMSHAPLFQVMLVLQNAPREQLHLGTLAVELESVKLESAKFDLTLSLEAGEGGELKGGLEYSTDLFDETTTRRMVEHFKRLLEEIAADPSQRVSELPLLTAGERQELLFEFNDTTQEYARGRCVHELFEAQAERSPEAVALIAGERSLTYAALNSRANQLARHLRSLGVKADQPVGIMLERSPEIVVGLLGILKAGGAYLPLDPTLPQERLAFMLADAGVAALLTQQRFAGMLPEGATRVVYLDSEWENTIARQSVENVVSGVVDDNLAYVIYTSGSTGLPKGTMIRHGGLANYLRWCTEAYKVAEGTTAPVHSSIGFDLTVTSLFSPLVAGGRVILIEERESLDALDALRSGSGYGLVKITPAHLEMLSQQMKADEVRGWTRALVIGGEALFNESLRFWREHAPQTRLINEYGPTETVVGCCVYEVGAGDAPAGAVPIGRPIANTQIYVLDGRLQPTPRGLTGEIYIGGEGLARGYLKRPELTAEKFIPDPFSRVTGARMYRTGDLGRHLMSGQVEYLGRVDQQVKIRGYRIELGEIEVVLGEHAGVEECVVTISEGASGDRRLVAYVTGGKSHSGQLASDELRLYLKERLPDYMIPSAFVALDTLPLTPNGKIDRRALPLPEQVHREDELTLTAPRTALEEVLAGYWSEILGIEQIGVDENFFELGGHSLLATQIISRVREMFQVELPLRSLFQEPTVAGLAARIQEAEEQLGSSEKIARMLRQLGNLSEAEAEGMLGEEHLASTRRVQP